MAASFVPRQACDVACWREADMRQNTDVSQVPSRPFFSGVVLGPCRRTALHGENTGPDTDGAHLIENKDQIGVFGKKKLQQLFPGVPAVRTGVHLGDCHDATCRRDRRSFHTYV